MEHLNIDSGGVSLAVNGDESRVITIYPTDVRFADDFFGLVKVFGEKEKEVARQAEALKGRPGAVRESLALLRNTYAFMRGEIDRVFGPGTALTVFGEHDSLAAYIQFFQGLEPYIRRARQNEIDRYLKKMDEGAVMEL